MEPDCRAIIKVGGRVQGVGYRYATLQMARILGLKGYVKNLPDDSVYIEVQGRPESVRNLIEWCKTGPRNAVVESFEYSFHPAMDLGNFQIR